MQFKEVSPEQLSDNFIDIISREWMLVSAGNQDDFNMMTASWGGAGEMWGKHVAMTVIRPQRYTKEFIDREDFFTLSFYGDDKAVHKICGSKSGRDIDKQKETGLTPVFSDGTVYFEEARLVLVCKKLFAQDMDPDGVLDSAILERWYPDKDYHRLYVGEIIKAYVK